jgi:hypothetical protein
LSRTFSLSGTSIQSEVSEEMAEALHTTSHPAVGTPRAWAYVLWLVRRSGVVVDGEDLFGDYKCHMCDVITAKGRSV